MNNSWKTAGAAFLAVGLVSTWDTPVAAQSTPLTFNGEITPTTDLYDVYFLLAAGPCSPAYSQLIADFIPANTATPFSITIDASTIGNDFTVMGLYDTVNGGVSLGFDPGEATDILSQYPAPGYDGPWVSGYNSTADEPTVASILESGTYDGQSLDDSEAGGLVDPNAGTYYWQPDYGTEFYSQISTDPDNPSDFTLIDFSGAAPGGSGFAVEVVPEPASLSLLAIGLLSCGWLRRRESGQ